MSQTYKKVSGVWQPIKKIFKNIGGAWTEVKKGYKKVNGVWEEVHSGALEYTFSGSLTATSSTGILLSDYFDPTSADEFIITVNAGVVLTGTTGANGGNGAAGHSNISRANCHGTQGGNGGNGGNGGSGGSGIDFTGFSGKQITFINNGTVSPGAGGNGGNGGNPAAYDCEITSYGGCGGSLGVGGSWDYASTGVTIIWEVGASTTSNDGTAGSHGSPTSLESEVCQTCFTADQLVLMANGIYKMIKDVVVNDYVIDMYGKSQKVLFLDRPMQGDRVLYKINNLITTHDHPIAKANRKGFMAINVEVASDEIGYYPVINSEGGIISYHYDFIDTNITEFDKLMVGSTIATVKGEEEVTNIEATDLVDQQLYSLVTAGSHTFSVNGYFVGGFISDKDFDYTKGEMR
jgi:hypothetical protein